MTDRERSLFDCPEPCGYYAEGYAVGKDKAFFEIRMVLEESNHAFSCGCEPCLVIRAVRDDASTTVPRGTSSP